VFYSEGDSSTTWDLGCYAGVQYSRGDDWKKTRRVPAAALTRRMPVGKTVPPVTGQTPTHCVRAIGGHKDDRGGRVFDQGTVSQFQ